MIAKCPECGFSGNIKDELIPDVGRNVGCPKCKNKFIVRKQQDEIPLVQSTPKRVEEKTNSTALAPKSVSGFKKNELNQSRMKGTNKFLVLALAFVMVAGGLYYISRWSGGFDSSEKMELTEENPKKTDMVTEALTPEALTPSALIDEELFVDELSDNGGLVESEKPKIYRLMLKDGTFSDYFIYYRYEGELVYITISDGKDGYYEKAYDKSDIQDFTEVIEVPSGTVVYGFTDGTQPEDFVKREMRYEFYKEITWLYVTERYTEAIAVGNTCIDECPDCPTCYYYRGQSYLHLNDIEKAKRDIAKACELGDNGGCSLLGRFKPGITAKELLESLAEVEKERERRNKDYQCNVFAKELIEEGDRYIKSGEYKKAIWKYNNAIDVCPDIPLPYELRALANEAIWRKNLFDTYKVSIEDYLRFRKYGFSSKYSEKVKREITSMGNSYETIIKKDLTMACNLGSKNACNKLAGYDY